MKACGIVCEYNPFHTGHAYHIQKAKEESHCDIIICVMSSSFVQRGEPAIIDKWTRAKCAIEHGADLVLELPYIASTQSATYFAKNAMRILKLADVDYFCFGSESDDLEALLNYSRQLSQVTIDPSDSTVRSYENSLGKLNPNDILAINYLAYCDGIEPIAIQRTNDYHSDELDISFSSATSIRQAIYQNQDVSNYTPIEIEKPVRLEDYYPMIQFQLMIHTPEQLKEIFMMDEGIENLFIKNKNLPDLESFIQACLSKRYTRSKIQRTLIQLLTHTTKKQVNELPEIDYIRVLAMNKQGQMYLKEKDLPVASRFAQIPACYREMELKATDVYASVLDQDKKDELKKMELQSNICCY